MTDLLSEQTTEKTSSIIKIVSMPSIAEHEYFIRLKDFDKQVLAIMFASFVLTISAFVI